jgi:D-amino-acid dehydrogenase
VDRRRAEIAVLGGGIVGATAAYLLARQKIGVVLIDRAHEGQATAAGAGIISPGTRFVDGGTILPLVQAGTAFYPDLLRLLAEDGEFNTGYDVVGGLHVAPADEEIDLGTVLTLLTRRRDAGWTHIGDAAIVDGAAARRLFPALAPCAQAVHIPGAARIDGRRLQQCLVRAAVRHGARLIEGSGAVSVDGGRVQAIHVGDTAVFADVLIVATGAWSSELGGQLGTSLPVRPQRGQIAHLHLSAAETGGWPIVLSATHYLLTFPPDRVVVGATREDLDAYDHRVTAEGLHEVLHEALRLAPGLGDARVGEVGRLSARDA